MQRSQAQASNQRTPRKLPTCVVTLALLGAARCSSTPDLRSEFSQQLDQSATLIESDRLAEAHTAVTQLMSSIRDAGDDRYDLQMTICHALMVELHSAATDRTGFMKQPGAFEFNPLLESGNNEQVSPTAHRLAAVFHGWHLASGANRVTAGSDPNADVATVPANCERFADPSYAKNYVGLIVASSLAELGFRDQARQSLVGLPHPEYGQLFDPKTYEGSTSRDAMLPDVAVLNMLDQYNLPAHCRWYILATCHDIFRTRFDDLKRSTDPTHAYRFGCLAALGELEVDDQNFQVHNGYTLLPEWRDDFYTWVEDLGESTGSFQDGPDVMARGVVGSLDTGKPALQFTWTPQH